MVDVRNDLAVFQKFREALSARAPKTITAYLTTMHSFVAWLAELPDYSLSPEDLEAIAEHRRSPKRLGFAVQLAYLRYPGRAWEPSENILTY